VTRLGFEPTITVSGGWRQNGLHYAATGILSLLKKFWQFTLILPKITCPKFCGGNTRTLFRQFYPLGWGDYSSARCGNALWAFVPWASSRDSYCNIRTKIPLKISRDMIIDGVWIANRICWTVTLVTTTIWITHSKDHCNSVVLSPLANYTDRAIAAGQRS
jgi:hypothetical protein